MTSLDKAVEALQRFGLSIEQAAEAAKVIRESLKPLESLPSSELTVLTTREEDDRTVDVIYPFSAGEAIIAWRDGWQLAYSLKKGKSWSERFADYCEEMCVPFTLEELPGIPRNAYKDRYYFKLQQYLKLQGFEPIVFEEIEG